MSAVTNNTDPMTLDFALENSASFTVFANLPTPTIASHLTSATQAVNCGIPHWTDSASAGFGTPLTFVQDTTDGASAWCIDTSVGSNLCQNTYPMTTATAPPTAFQTPGIWGSMTGAAGTISGTANYNAYATPVAVDLVEANPVMADYTGPTPTNGVFLYHIQVFDPSGTAGTNPMLWGGNVVGYESRIDRTINVTGTSTKDDGCVNCLINGGITGGRLGTGHFWHANGGQITNNSTIVNVTGQGIALDGFVIDRIASTFAQGVSMGLVISTGATYTMGGSSTSAAITPGYSGVANGVQVCAGTFNVGGNGEAAWRYDSSHGGLTGLVTGSPTFELSGSTTAESHSGTGTVTITNGITVNTTNMDAAASATAFGGAAYWKGSFFGAL